jgi:NTE family protein
MRPHAKILRDHPFFSRFTSRTLNRLTAQSSIVEFPRGAFVYQAGQPALAMYVVLSGRCQAQALLADGSESIIQIYAPGDIMGERAVITGEAHWSSAKVITDAVLLRLDGRDINRLLDKSPALARELVLRLIDQMKVLREDRPARKLGRVVVLVALSREVPGSVIAENCADALSRETPGPVIYLRIVDDPATPMLADWKRLYASWDEGARRATGAEPHKIRISVCGDPLEPEIIAPLISHLAGRFRHVLVLLDPEVPAAVVEEFMTQSDLAYALFRQQAEDMYKLNLLTRQLAAPMGAESARVLPLLCLDFEERPQSWDELRRKCGVELHAVLHCLPRHAGEDQHTHVARNPRGRFSFHIRRLAREIGRCRVGLALSSGGAKGYSYVGIIQVLEENDIHVDVVVGTSIGAYVGALWSYGLDGNQLQELALGMESRFALLRLVDPALPPRRGFMRGGKVERLLRQSIRDAHFSDCMRDFRVVATDLDTLERVVYSSGEVAPCVHGSMAMPGIMVPVQVGGRTVIDGGIADPLPVDVLIEMGVEKIIAVNTIPTPEEMRLRAQVTREMSDLDRRQHRTLSTMNQYVNYFAPGNILDIMMRGVHGAQSRVSEGACKQADVVLRPIATDGKWHDFTRPRPYITIGRRTAEEKLAELKALVRKD